MKTPHKHAELIKAWADGKQIQFKVLGSDGDWLDSIGPENPSWSDLLEYRIKPEAPKWPVTRMDGFELAQIWNDSIGEFTGYVEVANAAIARAIEDGDVITVEESRKRCAAAVCASQEGMVHESMLEEVAKVVIEALGEKPVIYAYAGLLRDKAWLASIIASVKEKQE